MRKNYVAPELKCLQGVVHKCKSIVQKRQVTNTGEEIIKKIVKTPFGRVPIPEKPNKFKFVRQELIIFRDEKETHSPEKIWQNKIQGEFEELKAQQK